MSVVAFIYNDYDRKHGIKDAFAGHYASDGDARNALRGERYERQNLEIMNLDTLGFTEYRWTPLYVHESSYVDGKQVQTLAHRWSVKHPIITLEWDGEARRYGHDNVFYDAGEWESPDRHYQSEAHAQHTAEERAATARQAAAEQAEARRIAEVAAPAKTKRRGKSK